MTTRHRRTYMETHELAVVGDAGAVSVAYAAAHPTDFYAIDTPTGPVSGRGLALHSRVELPGYGRMEGCDLLGGTCYGDVGFRMALDLLESWAAADCDDEVAYAELERLYDERIARTGAMS